MQLIENWEAVIKHAWSVRLVVFWSLLNGGLIGLAAFIGHMSHWTYLALNMVGYVTIGLARLYKQPGA